MFDTPMADGRPQRDDTRSSASAGLLPLLNALALTAIAAVTIRGADVAGPALARMWAEIVGVSGRAAPSELAPLVAGLGTAAVIAATYAVLVRLRLADDVRETPLALGIVGRDVPFLLAGLVFVALYASLADGLARAGGVLIATAAQAPNNAATLLGLVLVVPLSQELLLRGGLLPSLERRVGTAAAIVLSSLAGLAATPPVAELTALALVPHLFFGWMAWSCRSLGAAAVLHATYIFIRLYLVG
jgi:membrane protease YdiL (CAAX protease family)